jgi:hypothetical protein
MSYVTKNIPNPELVEVFEKLPAPNLLIAMDLLILTAKVNVKS